MAIEYDEMPSTGLRRSSMTYLCRIISLQNGNLEVSTTEDEEH
jgi:hypothetical protein